MEKELVVKNSIFINAPAAIVWNTLTDSAMTKMYMFDCEAISDWKAGSSLIWKGASDGKVYVKGAILKIEPEKFLQYTTFNPNGEYEDVPSNYLAVIYDLSQERDGTLLTVSQGDFAGERTDRKSTKKPLGAGVWCSRR